MEQESLQQGSPSVTERISYSIATLPPLKKLIFLIAFIACLIASFSLLSQISERYLVLVPDYGGELNEGVIGRPRFINPVLAKSDVDRDLTQLIFSGLLKSTPDHGLIPDLASSYDISQDGLTYTFTLRDQIFWHDGEPITAQDVAFTIEKVQDKSLAIKSPRRASWDDVTVETPDNKTVVLTLKQAYAPFLENTTMGIIPKHIWMNIPNDEFDQSFYNLNPIGSGPYRIDIIVNDESKGLPESYHLRSFHNYALGRPYIDRINLHFFGNSNELINGYREKKIDQIHTIAPSVARELESIGTPIARTELPRTFAAFINSTENESLKDRAVREAMNHAVNKEKIIEQVLLGYGKVIDGPLPYLLGTSSLAGTHPIDEATRANESRAILEKAGWEFDKDALIMKKVDKKAKKEIPLEFSISVPDAEELTKTAQLLKEDWERIGAKVTVKVYEISTFSVEVLAPRKYDVLFYGQVIGRNPDLYPYWHSSQRTAPGLNVALYASRPTDKLLEELRKEHDEMKREEILHAITDEIWRDIPAVFVYSPYFLYARRGDIEGAVTGTITTESERFLDVHNWFIEKDHVWRFFRDKMGRQQSL